MGEHTALPKLPSCILGVGVEKGGEGKGGEERRGEERKGWGKERGGTGPPQ